MLDKHVSRLSPIKTATKDHLWLWPPTPDAHIGYILIQTPMTYWWITAVANPSPIVWGDFITPPRSSKMIIKGFNGATATTKVGTVQWKLQDDTGQIHTITLPETYYSESVENRLLSPQHWAQVARQGKGTKCTTYHDCIVLSWGKGQYKKTIPLSSSNVGVITAPPGITSFLHTCQLTMCFPSTTASPDQLPVVSNSDDDPDQPLAPPDHAPALVDQPTESTRHN
jgi:hypothetical protein